MEFFSLSYFSDIFFPDFFFQLQISLVFCIAVLFTKINVFDDDNGEIVIDREEKMHAIPFAYPFHITK